MAIQGGGENRDSVCITRAIYQCNLSVSQSLPGRTPIFPESSSIYASDLYVRFIRQTELVPLETVS